MKVLFIANESPRETELAAAFIQGVRMHPDDTAKITNRTATLDTDADVVCFVGVKSIKLFQQARAQGKQTILFDKGYLRHRHRSGCWEYWRMSVNSIHPVKFVSQANRRWDRWASLALKHGLKRKPWREQHSGSHVLLAGSSPKYHNIAGLEHPVDYYTKIAKEIQSLTKRRVIYRPKPTDKSALPIDNAMFSYGEGHRGISKDLEGAWCLVTNGSNAAFDAILAGVPCIVLGNSIGRPLSSNSLDRIENPYLASDEEVSRWLANLAWCMFTNKEMMRGLAWETLRPQLCG